MRYYLFICLLFLASCCGPEVNYCMQTGREFVLDSYKIRQGKFSILELEGECVPPLPPEFLDEYEDKIDEDDVLRVAVFHPTRKDLSEAVCSVGNSVGYRVINGSIHLPGLNPVYLQGLTLHAARDKIQWHYDTEIANAEVFLEYSERLHSKVELAGAVKVPEVAVNGRIRLYEVLAIAGVPTTANLFKSYVLREGMLLPIDLYKLVHEGDMSQNIVMRPRDKIFIADPAAAFR